MDASERMLHDVWKRHRLSVDAVSDIIRLLRLHEATTVMAAGGSSSTLDGQLRARKYQALRIHKEAESTFWRVVSVC